jgi:hypothetical protein
MINAMKFQSLIKRNQDAREIKREAREIKREVEYLHCTKKKKTEKKRVSMFTF